MKTLMDKIYASKILKYKEWNKTEDIIIHVITDYTLISDITKFDKNIKLSALSIDSLDLLDIQNTLENLFLIRLKDNDLNKNMSINDIINLVIDYICKDIVVKYSVYNKI